MTQEKKMDRRTIYTKNVICQSFLKLKNTRDFNHITISDICREAQISRGTFYLHYKNITEVLDELLERAFSETLSLTEQLSAPGCKSQCGYPLCQYIRNSSIYRCLFFDDTLSPYIIEKIYRSHKEALIEAIGKKTHLPPQQLSMLAYFQLTGCFLAAKRGIGLSDAQWEKNQSVIDTFILGGLKALEK